MAIVRLLALGFVLGLTDGAERGVSLLPLVFGD